MKRLRMAVVGAGRLGGFHAQKLAALDTVELAAVADPLPEAGRRVAAQCHTQAVTDPGDLLDQVDAVVIAAPTQLHYELGRMFLERGIHVLLEKPMCSTSAQAEDLVALARHNGAVLQVGHVERFNPAFHAATPYLTAPRYIEAVRSSGFTFRSTDVGAVLDLMIHDIDLVLALVRAPLRRVEALGVSVLGGHEDVANARLEFECGCVASLSASRVSYETQRRMHVWSPRAFASIDFATRAATIVEPTDRVLERRFDVAALAPEEVAHYRDHLFEDLLPRKEFKLEAVDALKLEIEDFVDSIRASRTPRVNGRQGCDAVRVAEEILGQIDAYRAAHEPGGPAARTAIIPAPHFTRKALEMPRRREAG